MHASQAVLGVCIHYIKFMKELRRVRLLTRTYREGSKNRKRLNRANLTSSRLEIN